MTQPREGITISIWKDSDGQGQVIVRGDDTIFMIPIAPVVVWAVGAKIDWTTCGKHPYSEALRSIGITEGHRSLHLTGMKGGNS